MTASTEQLKPVDGHLLPLSTSEFEMDDAEGLLNAGSNSLALHCHQSEGGQGVDVGLIKLKQPD